MISHLSTMFRRPGLQPSRTEGFSQATLFGHYRRASLSTVCRAVQRPGSVHVFVMPSKRRSMTWRRPSVPYVWVTRFASDHRLLMEHQPQTVSPHRAGVCETSCGGHIHHNGHWPRLAAFDRSTSAARAVNWKQPGGWSTRTTWARSSSSGSARWPPDRRSSCHCTAGRQPELHNRGNRREADRCHRREEDGRPRTSAAEHCTPPAGPAVDLEGHRRCASPGAAPFVCSTDHQALSRCRGPDRLRASGGRGGLLFRPWRAGRCCR
ncbi:hypothetical protein ACVWZD_008916 [Streptomyces sp. TE3672]